VVRRVKLLGEVLVVAAAALFIINCW
jgi:hypothetical protein